MDEKPKESTEQRTNKFFNTVETADFIKLEYESVIVAIERLNNQKLAYQKLYIALITVIGSVSIALLKLQSRTSNIGLEISHLIGFLQILAAILGFGVIRNLAAVRRNAVFWVRNLNNVRSIVIQQLRLPSNYPSGQAPRASDRTSSDYITIVTCSIVNMLVFLSSVVFLFYSIGPLPLAVISGAVILGYAVLHVKFIESFLQKKDT